MARSGLLINLTNLSARPTGLTTYATNLVATMGDLDPTILAPSPPAGTASHRFHRVPGGMSSDQGLRGHLKRLRWTQRQLPGLFKELGASLLFSPLPEAPLWSGVRSVVTVHDLTPLRLFKRTAPLAVYTRHYVSRVLAQAAHIVCDSTSTVDDVMQFFGVPARRLTPVLLAHDAENFRFLDLERERYYLCLGRIDPYKNVASAVAALARLPQSDHELWVAGPADDRYMPTLRAQVEALGLASRVKFLDYIAYEDLPVILNRATALVFPSLYEGFGLPVLEAMACGTPVIASNRASIPEVTGDAALLVEPEDVDGIANAMHRVATEPTLRAELRAAGLARAEQFSWAKTGAETADVLRTFL